MVITFLHLGETVFKLKVSGPVVFVSLVERYNLVGLWSYILYGKGQRSIVGNNFNQYHLNSS